MGCEHLWGAFILSTTVNESLMTCMHILGQLLRFAVNGESHLSIEFWGLKNAPQNKHQSQGTI